MNGQSCLSRRYIYFYLRGVFDEKNLEPGVLENFGPRSSQPLLAILSTAIIELSSVVRNLTLRIFLIGFQKRAVGFPLDVWRFAHRMRGVSILVYIFYNDFRGPARRVGKMGFWRGVFFSRVVYIAIAG